MLNKLFKRFKNENQKNISTVDISKATIDKTEINMVKPEEINVFEMAYRNIVTGEIGKFDSRNFEEFDRVMSDKNNQLIFG